MIVVADTSPINYLVLIDSIDLLQQLYVRVYLPAAVWKELQHPAAPPVVRAWCAVRPEWVEIGSPKEVLAGVPQGLESGEREAIALAIELGAGLILMDDWEARQEAVRRSLTAVGTLGILADAAALGLIDLPMKVRELQRTNFRVRQSVIHDLLKRNATRIRDSR